VEYRRKSLQSFTIFVTCKTCNFFISGCDKCIDCCIYMHQTCIKIVNLTIRATYYERG
jgi:hypothetical protein